MFKDNQSFSGFSVNDGDKALAFYRDALGINVEVLEGMGFRMLLNGTTVFVYDKGSDHTPATFTVLNFIVADIEKAVAGLKEKGLRMEIIEGMEQDEYGIMRGKQADMGPDIAWFKDPAGNTLSVLQD